MSRATSHEPLATNLPSFREVQAFVGGVVCAWFFAGFYVAFLYQVVDEGRVRCSGSEHFFRRSFFAFDGGDEGGFFVVCRRCFLDVRQVGQEHGVFLVGQEKEAAYGDGLAQQVAFFGLDIHFIADDVELVRREVIEFLGDFQCIGIAEGRCVDAVDVQGVGQAAHDEGRVVGDQGLTFDEVFQAGLPVFAEFIGLGEFVPLIAAFDGRQVVFWRTDVEVTRILQFAVVEFSQGQETDGIGLFVGQFQGDGREVLREAAQFPFFFDGIFVIAVIGLDVVVVGPVVRVGGGWRL